MRKFIPFLIAFIAAGYAYGQHGGPSIGYSFGTVQCEACEVAGYKKNLFTTGVSAGGDITGIMDLVSLSVHYNNTKGRDEIDLADATRKLELSQNLVKFMVGYGGVLGDRALLMAQFGFTIGKDYLRIYREYDDGTISYGMEDLRTGVWEGFRPLAPLIAVTGGYHIGAYFFPYVQVQKGFAKGFGTWQFQDWHFHKEESLWLNSGGSGTYTYLAEDKLPNFKVEVGIKWLFGNEQ